MASLFKFNPEGSGYDIKTAKKLGYTRDAVGHLPTRDYRTGMILKGKKHPTFSKGVMQDFRMGYQLMKEGEIVTVITNSETSLPLSVEMPPSVILEVVSTEPGVKGNTATNATKPATLETGAVVNVPLFINEGDKIKVDTFKGNYKERHKE